MEDKRKSKICSKINCWWDRKESETFQNRSNITKFRKALEEKRQNEIKLISSQFKARLHHPEIREIANESSKYKLPKIGSENLLAFEPTYSKEWVKRTQDAMKRTI